MEIRINQLIPNPFRNIKQYPINRDKVKALSRSIDDTGFWDNILARESPTEKAKYEIAYGHHRWKALHKLYGEDSRKIIDIPIKDLDDEMMLKIMANENATDWSMDTTVIVETVRVTENYLKDKSNIGFPENQRAREQITKFLGGVYNEHLVANALSIIHAVDEKLVDAQAVRTITEPSKAAEFVRAIKQSDKPVKQAMQRKIAAKIVDEGRTKSEIKDYLKYSGYAPTPKKQPDIADFLADNRWKVKQLTKYIDELNKCKEDLRGLEWVTFRTACMNLAASLSRLLNAEGKEVRNGKDQKAIEDKKTGRVSG